MKILVVIEYELIEDETIDEAKKYIKGNIENSLGCEVVSVEPDVH